MKLLVVFVLICSIAIESIASEKTKVVVLKKNENKHPRAELKVQDFSTANDKFTLSIIIVMVDDDCDGTPFSYGDDFRIEVKPRRSETDKGDMIIHYSGKHHHTNQGPSLNQTTRVTISYYQRKFRIEYVNREEQFDQTWEETEDIAIFTEQKKFVLGQRQIGEIFAEGFIGFLTELYMYAEVYSYEEIVQRKQELQSILINWAIVEIEVFDGAFLQTADISEYKKEPKYSTGNGVVTGSTQPGDDDYTDYTNGDIGYTKKHHCKCKDGDKD